MKIVQLDRSTKERKQRIQEQFGVITAVADKLRVELEYVVANGAGNPEVLQLVRAKVNNIHRIFNDLREWMGERNIRISSERYEIMRHSFNALDEAIYHAEELSISARFGALEAAIRHADELNIAAVKFSRTSIKPRMA